MICLAGEEATGTVPDMIEMKGTTGITETGAIAITGTTGTAGAIGTGTEGGGADPDPRGRRDPAAEATGAATATENIDQIRYRMF